MLTIISKFNNFRNRQGEYYTTEDLTKLSKAVITSDVIHFKGNISYGFNSIVANCIYKHIDKKYKNGKILIINDLSLHMINKLTAEGFDINNIYLAYGKWTKGAGLDKDQYVYETMKKHIEVSFKEKLNVIKLEDIFNMQFDLVIANPPYGRIGAQITKKIIDDVDCKEFINLLPANDYKRVPELWQYQSDMISLNNAFSDAAVTTHLAKIYKNKVNDLTKEEFEIYNYLDKSLYKYFLANLKKEHYAIDNSVYKPKIKNFEELFNLKKCLFIGKRYIAGEHFPYTKNCAGYKVNKERNISFKELMDISSKAEQKNGNVGDFSLVQFNTEEEQINITNFLYGDQGFKFMTKILTCMNADSYCNVSRFLPKVDWTRSWTVEEILKDYGYTDLEIQEVMEDLNNYKGQDN